MPTCMARRYRGTGREPSLARGTGTRGRLAVPVTMLGCGTDQVCPCAAPLGRIAWNAHREYVSCIQEIIRELLSQDRIAVDQVLRAEEGRTSRSVWSVKSWRCRYRGRRA